MKICALVLFPILACLTACSSSCSTINTGSINPNDNLQGPVIVLFHGLNKDISSLSNIKNQLERKFLHEKIEAFERDKQQNIKEQAQKTYQELKTKELYQRDLVFVGISTGGVVAIETLNQHPELTVKGIITYHAPLEGFRMAELLADKDKMKHALRSASNPLIKDCVSRDLNGLVDRLVDQLNTPVVQDLRPKAPFMQNFKANLLKIAIPILTISGAIDYEHQDKLKEDPAYYNELSKVLYPHSPHDGFIPIDSQGASNIAIKNSERISCSVDHWQDPPPVIMDKIKETIEKYLEN